MVTAPCADTDGRDTIRQFLVPRAEVELIDDWFVLGLAGTGSKSVKAAGIFVPAHRTITQDDLLNGTAPAAMSTRMARPTARRGGS